MSDLSVDQHKKVPTFGVSMTNLADISTFTGVPVSEIKEGTIFQMGPYVSKADYDQVVSELDQLRAKLASQHPDPEAR